MKLYFLLLIVATVNGCDIGWIDAGGDFCYKIGTTDLTYGEAQEVQ